MHNSLNMIYFHLYLMFFLLIYDRALLIWPWGEIPRILWGLKSLHSILSSGLALKDYCHDSLPENGFVLGKIKKLWPQWITNKQISVLKFVKLTFKPILIKFNYLGNSHYQPMRHCRIIRILKVWKNLQNMWLTS